MLNLNPKTAMNAFWALLVVCSFIGCQGDVKPKEEISDDSVITEEETAETPALQTKDLLYSWVDKLNIRDQPNTEGKTVATVHSEDPLSFTGEQSDKSETIVLRGVAYNETWLKVITTDNIEGWVFGGAVKRKDEAKGNAIITDTQFDFPHFGNFDLSNWQNQGKKNSSGGESESVTTTYKRGKQILESTKIEIGEHGYGRNYVLKDAQGNVLKERSFYFIVDADLRELTETVKDYTSGSPKQYTRSQKLIKHYNQLNAKPEMVNGTWVESSLEVTVKKEFEIFSINKKAPAGVDLDGGCTCTFRSQPKDYKTTIFRSTYEDPPKEKAIIQLDGKFVVLNSKKFPNPDSKLGDYHAFYYNDKYDLQIVAFKVGKDDGGGAQYSGTMKLSLKDGTVLSDINTFGGCGC